MSFEATVSVESHRSAATLYLSGELTTDVAMRAIAQAGQLPENVRALRVDLRGVGRADAQAIRVLEIGLREWRSARQGMSHVTLPACADEKIVALKFTHQRWSPRAQVRPPAIGQAGTLRIRDYRQAAVTRSLRERAGSETR